MRFGQNADTCVPKEPKYRGLDDCGCTLNTVITSDYTIQVGQRKLTRT